MATGSGVYMVIGIALVAIYAPVSICSTSTSRTGNVLKPETSTTEPKPPDSHRQHGPDTSQDAVGPEHTHEHKTELQLESKNTKNPQPPQYSAQNSDNDKRHIPQGVGYLDVLPGHPLQGNNGYDRIHAPYVTIAPGQTKAEVTARQDKRFVDSIAGNLLKKSFLQENKRFIDSIAGDLLKRSSSREEIRYIDSIAGDLLKKSQLHGDKRYIDSIAGDLLKKSRSEVEKRDTDSNAGDLLRRSQQADNPWSDRSYVDSTAGGPGKLDQHEYAGPDRHGAVSAVSGQPGKNNGDGVHPWNIPISSDGSQNMDFTPEKSHPQDNKRFVDSINGDLLKRSFSQNVKRYIDSISGDLLKRSFSQNVKRYIDSIADSLLKKSDPQQDKRFIDSIAGDLLKKKSYAQEEKRYIDPIAGTLLKRSYPQENKKDTDSVAGELLQKSNHQKDKRFIDSIAGELLKKSTPVENKRYIDLIAGSLLKKSHPQVDKRFIDSIAGNLLKKSHPQVDKRFIDSIAGELLKKSYPQTDKRYFDSIAGNLLRRSHVGLLQSKRYQHINTGYPLMKSVSPANVRYNVWDQKWSQHSVNGFPLKPDGNRSEKRFIDSIAGELLKRNNALGRDNQNERHINPVLDDLQRLEERKENQRYLDFLGDVLVSGENIDKRFLDWITGHLLKKHLSHLVKDPSQKHHTDSSAGRRMGKNGVANSTKETLTNVYTDYTGSEGEMRGFNNEYGQEVSVDHSQTVNTQGRPGNKDLWHESRTEKSQQDHTTGGRQPTFTDASIRRSQLTNEGRARRRRAINLWTSPGSAAYPADSSVDGRAKRSGQFQPMSASRQVVITSGRDHYRQKRVIDIIASHLLERLIQHLNPVLDAFPAPPRPGVKAMAGDVFLKKQGEKYQDLMDSAFKRSSKKRYTDHLSGDLLRKYFGKRFIDTIAGHLLKRQTGKTEVDDSVNDNMPEKSVIKRLMYPETEKFLNYPDNKRIKKLMIAALLKRLADNMQHIHTMSNSMHTRPLEVHYSYLPSQQAGALQKRTWMDRPFPDSTSEDLLNKRPRPSLLDSREEVDKRFITPTVWQLLFKNNLYRYEGVRRGNFIDSIAGELLKRDHSIPKHWMEIYTGDSTEREENLGPRDLTVNWTPAKTFFQISDDLPMYVKM